LCGPKKGGLPVDQMFLGKSVERRTAIQPGSRALTRHRLRCWRSWMRVWEVFMPSTLTAGGEDGKQSKKIERNTLKVGVIEILLLW